MPSEGTITGDQCVWQYNLVWHSGCGRNLARRKKGDDREWPLHQSRCPFCLRQAVNGTEQER